MRAWILDRAPHEPMVREFAQVGCAVRGASVDSIWSVLYAETQGTPVSIFVAPESEYPVPAGMERVELGGYEFWTAEVDGMVYVIWEYHPDGVVCAAVARGEMQKVLRLVVSAEDLMKQAG